MWVLSAAPRGGRYGFYKEANIVLEHLVLAAQYPKVQIIAAGAAGGLVRWFRLKETTADGLRSVCIGAVTSYYLAEALVPIVEPVLNGMISDPVSRASFVGFMIGFSGTAIVGFIRDMLFAKHMRDNRKED